MPARRFALLLLPTLTALTLSACVGTQQAPPPSAEAAWYQAAADNEAARAGDRAAVERVIRRTFVEAPDKAAATFWCESRFDPAARNGQYLGIGQLGSYHYWRFDAYGGLHLWSDPVVNIQVAHDLWSVSGWGPWECA